MLYACILFLIIYIIDRFKMALKRKLQSYNKPSTLIEILLGLVEKRSKMGILFRIWGF